MSKTAVATIPEGFESVPVMYDSPVVIPEGTSVPYVKFVTTEKILADFRSDIPTVQLGDPILVSPEPAKPVKLGILKYFLLGREQFYAKYDSSGSLTAYSATKPLKEARFTEVFETVAILFVGKDLLVPVSIRFKGPQCPGVTKAVAALDEARTPAWLEKGEEYAATGAIEAPWARFTASTVRGPQREGENGPYQTLEKVVIAPTSEKEYTLLRSFMSGADFKAVLKDTIEVFKLRVANAKKKAVK